ncbi:MAG: DUF4906 domain-containing protein [Parabacteroides sp.]|nr:DUF4906 domain-containing protein [Parabacteroides sp.]
MTLLSLVLMNTGCEEQIDPTKVPSNEGRMVEVSLNIGFADEADGYTLATKSDASSDKGTFSYELQPSVITKGDATRKPDKLYNLEIQQYDQTGKRIGGLSSAVAEQAIGSTISLDMKADSNCQLVIVAWGKDNDSIRLGTSNTLEAVRKLSINASVINSIPTDNMNKMPYVLHLEHVDATTSTIRSREGEDVRLLLKRLAARLTLNWEYLYDGYTLNQILLESIPTNYNIVPNPDKTDKTYPSLLDQFTTIQIDPTSESGKSPYSCWIPANVRGTNLAATSQNFRTKANAPTGSSYASFIAGNNADSKKKLNYRVYLGGSTSSDFNIRSNTNYNYTVNFNHKGLPVNDYRVTIIDPIPASVNNNNLVPTANCFMVAPGGAFCFNPYQFYVNGQSVTNEIMASSDWCNINGTTIGASIKSVKVLWQTKENGDIGDPVLGVVTSATEHTNIVDLENCDKLEKARIYCRVAPNTTGGSGLIVAYDDEKGEGNILWSWHIWVTGYRPSSTGNSSVDEDNKQKQKYTYGGYNDDQLPMMDRNLGAQAGYNTVPPSALEKAKTNGFLYQWGRKDPSPASYTSDESIVRINANLDKPTVGILNLYSPDGFSYYPLKIDTKNRATFREAYKTPATIVKGDNNWNKSIDELGQAWGGNSDKTVHDPCPAGWRITEVKNYCSLFSAANISFSYNSIRYYQGTINKVAGGTSATGGVVIKFDNSNRSTYIRYIGYWFEESVFNFIGTTVFLWCRDNVTAASGQGSAKSFQTAPGNSAILYNSGVLREAMPVRCIQERK